MISSNKIITPTAPNEGNSTPSKRLAVARKLAERGLKLFPLREGSKLPAHKGWQDEATADPATLEKWWSKGDRNIGISTGASGLVVFDCDDKAEDGVANFLALLGGQEPSTFTVETPSGGRHYLFSGAPVSNSASRIAPAVDIRSKGGLVVAPGSTTEKGTYRVINNVPISPIPQTLIEAIARAYVQVDKVQLGDTVELDTPAAYSTAIAYLSEAEQAVEGRGGNDTTYRVAARLRDFGLSAEAALDCMDILSGWNEANNPPWPRDELAEILDHAWSYGQNSPGSASVELEFDEIPEDLVIGVAAANDNRTTGVLARATLDIAALSGQPIPERNWHVEGWIPGNNVTLLYGDGGTGKSLLAMQLAVATATARPWLGLSVRQGRAIYLTAEDDAAELHRRIANIASREDLAMHDLAANLKVVSLVADDPALAIPKDADRIKHTPLWRELVGAIDAFKPKLIILDTLADVFAGNENVRNQARGFIAQLRAPAIAHDAAFVVLAHPSRAGLATPGLNAGSGSSGSTAWHNSVRSRLELARGGDKNPDGRTLTAKKANYSRAGAAIQLTWLNGVFEGSAEATTAGGAAAARDAERVFLDMLDAYTEEGRHVSAATGTTYAPAMFADDAGSRAIDKGQLADAMNRLFHAGVIEVVTTGPASRRRGHIARASTAELSDAA